MIMAYQPPTKSNYGDELLLEDKWNQSKPTDTYGYSDGGEFTGQQSPQSPKPLFNQQSDSNYYNQPNLQHQQPNQNGYNSNVVQGFGDMKASLTPEDMVFIRQWQRDSFINRVIPLTTLSWSLYYFYNKQNQRPQLISRYLAIGMGAFILGKISYKNEFKRRLTESNLNTPYMQIFRKQFGVPQLISDNDHVHPGQMSENDHYGYGNSTANSYTMVQDPYSKPMSRAGFSKPFQPNQEQGLDSSSNVPEGTETLKQGTSYEELRARNRGYIR